VGGRRSLDFPQTAIYLSALQNKRRIPDLMLKVGGVDHGIASPNGWCRKTVSDVVLAHVFRSGVGSTAGSTMNISAIG
jgi:hypothetical protein